MTTTAEPDIIAQLTPDLEAQKAIGVLLAMIVSLEQRDPRWRLGWAIQTGDLWLAGEAEKAYRDAVRRIGLPELEPP